MNKFITIFAISQSLFCYEVAAFVSKPSLLNCGRNSREISREGYSKGAAFNEEDETKSTRTEGSITSRTDFIRRMIAATSSAVVFAKNSPANAAPPFAIMAEEVGYFPVTDERTGQTVMVPAKPKRESTDQATELAKYLQSSGAKMYGSFWCPHCSRQKELFGREAWKLIDYVECSPKGYRSKYATCIDQGIDGYPTWKFGNATPSLSAPSPPERHCM
eukprot:CCRYP_009854-RA/>CCRYP_009854-RA protein AED:0.21 eAED:0.21 QI:188/1/1/1/0/0/2/1115/217